VPTRRAINPIRTAGCAIKSSCNAGSAKLPFSIEESKNQCLVQLRDLVTLPPYANTRDDETAKHGPARHGSARRSRFGSPAQSASELDWRLCWPLCRQGPSSSVDAGGYADRDEITSSNTCIGGALRGPWRPPLRGPIICRRRTWPVLTAATNWYPPRHIQAFDRPRQARSGKADSLRWF
jgi:hypothetical protein